MKSFFVLVLVAGAFAGHSATNVVDLGTVLVEGTALSKYRPEKVEGGTFTGDSNVDTDF